MIRPLLAAGIALLCAGPVQAAEITGTARVIDGDTLVVAGQHVRLAGIDAPEIMQLCMIEVPGDSIRHVVWERCGYQAARAMSVAVIGGVSCRTNGHDRYGRIVAICGTAETADLGEAMVRSGWAVSYPKYDPDCRYCDAEGEAQREKRGLWAGEFDMPWQWRHEHERK